MAENTNINNVYVFRDLIEKNIGRHNQSYPRRRQIQFSSGVFRQEVYLCVCGEALEGSCRLYVDAHP